MTNLELIQNFYASENFRDLKFVDSLFDDNVSLEWNSTIGLRIHNKSDIMNFSRELFENYSETKVIIKTIFGDENNVAVHYEYFAKTIENPNEWIQITKVLVLWEFINNKIIKGFQTTVLQ